MLFLQNNMLLRHFDMKENKRTCYLNSNNGTGILAFGGGPYLRIDSTACFDQINQFTIDHENSYVFALFSYDLKNGIENLSSKNADETA